MAKIPEKLFFKIGEVCDLTETQPYVLRFWESEFPQLAPRKNRSGQRIYSSEDIEVVEDIKRLLYEEGYTIAGARKRLEDGDAAGNGEKAAKKPSRKAAKAAAAQPAAKVTAAGGDQTVRKLREILELMDETDRKLR